MSLDKIYGDAIDKYVIASILYTDGVDEYLFTDVDCTVKAEKATILDAAFKGLVVEYVDDLTGKITALNPVSFKDEGDYVSVVVVDYDDFSTLYSSEKA